MNVQFESDEEVSVKQMDLVSSSFLKLSSSGFIKQIKLINQCSNVK